MNILAHTHDATQAIAEDDDGGLFLWRYRSPFDRSGVTATYERIAPEHIIGQREDWVVVN